MIHHYGGTNMVALILTFSLNFVNHLEFLSLANALIKNDDSQTPLQVARVKGFSNVVRTMEVRI